MLSHIVVFLFDSAQGKKQPSKGCLPAPPQRHSFDDNNDEFLEASPIPKPGSHQRKICTVKQESIDLTGDMILKVKLYVSFYLYLYYLQDISFINEKIVD